MKDVWAVIQALAWVKLQQNYLIDFRVTVGPSMEPTFRSGSSQHSW